VLLVAAVPAMGCAKSAAPPVANDPAPRDSAAPSDSGSKASAASGACQEASMQEDVMKLRESTSPTVSDRRVGISNIYERDLPDAQGTVAPRLSAVLVIFDMATNETRRETVIEGSEVAIGADRYCVVGLEKGTTSPGSVSIRKLAS
jgi:hypothetical protein